MDRACNADIYKTTMVRGVEEGAKAIVAA